MKVSIITAVYNNANQIKDTIASVRAQKNIDIEYIIIDGGSTDGTIDIVHANRDVVNIFVSERDNGIYDALNKGVSLATGDFVGFLHSDDVFYDENALSLLLSDSDGCNVVYGDLDYVSKNNINKIVRSWRPGTFSPSSIYEGWIPPHPALYVERVFFLKIGYFDEKYPIASDYHFMLRLFLNGSVKPKYVPVTVVKMRVGGASNNNFFNFLKKFQEQRAVLRDLSIGGSGVVARKMFSKMFQYIKR